MRILCDIGHPAHVHLFRNVLNILKAEGHTYVVTTRDKDVTLQLLRAYDMHFVTFGRHYTNMYGKLYGLVKYDCMLLNAAKRFRPDIFISHGSIYAAHVSALLRKPHISLEDTANMEQIRLYRPFTDAIITSTSFPKKLGKKQIEYDGYHELAYLHPRYFTPDSSIFDLLGMREGERFVVLRFISWDATHDLTRAGITTANKLRAAKSFAKYARVFITSEKKLPQELDRFRIHIPAERMHDALFYADLLYGESATMASECAILGTPAIYLDNVGRGYTTEEETKYGLVFNFSASLHDQEQSIRKGEDLLRLRHVKEHFKKKQQTLIKDKIDVTSFLAWLIENYPLSAASWKLNPNFQNKFRTYRS
jgi:predicted glycosyltransferase